MAEEIKTLRRQCTYVKAQLTRIRNSLNDSISSTAISIKKAKLEEVYHSFNKLHLELARVDETGDYENSIVEFESSYYACAEVLDNLQNSNKKSASTTSDQAKTLTNASVVLPRIDLPTFDGNLLEWQSFYDTFKAMVHENEDILGVQKFHYLKHSLRGEIAGVINTLNASYENYTVAWTMLIKRCNQPRKIIQMHLKSLFELPNLTKECPVALRSMITATEKHVNALKAIKIPVEAWNEILVYVVTAKLDKITRRHWDRSLDDDAMPTLAELLHFLSKFARDDALTTLANSPEAAHTQSNVRQYQKPAIQDYRVKTTRQTYITAQAKVKCPICTKGHYIQSCEKFLNLSVDNRFNAAKTAKLCINCLKSGHSCTACYSSTCKKCHRKHNTLLHREENNDSNTITPSTSAPAEQSRTTLTACLPSEVLLSTARLFISDIEGTFHECRVLLDSASQVNFITTDLAKKLRLSKTNVDIPVSGFNQLETRIRTSVTAIIASKHSAYKSEITLYVAPQFSGYLPSQQISHSHVQLPKNVPLADPQYYKPAKIDALLGAELFYQLMRVGQIRLSAPSLILQKTALGWVLSGAVSSKGIASKSVKCNLSSIPLYKQLAKFWEMEECATIKPRSKEEELCEDHFKIHTRRDVSGRYVVRLPFNQSKTKLGSSYGGALERFYALEKRLEQDASLKRAKNELSEIQRALTTPEHNTKILNYLSNEGITWHFSPPRSPHFGGLWEALVKSFKHHLIRIVGDQLFTYEYLNTYVIEIEAILNSRPLTPMSSDPNDTNALTPAHLLIGDSLMSMPERNLQQIATNRLSMWQHIQRVKQHFWAKWHKEYINQLNTRSKWRTSRGKALAIGDLVILKEDHVPSMKWILGRITDLHPGGDSIVRVVTVKTAHGTYKRSITRLCPLPTEDL
ncbi:uncharacterized protein LOC143350709 [Colletes latitarsis]|uniref:uncharacterized protein LOC143350709 n=1 Tax=Colletes latitarsis TaxID=2605962 RepID=UPI0040374A55